MTDPKAFYRELDKLLAAIRIDRTRRGLIPKVITLLESTFAGQLHINNGRMYEKRGDDFFLVYPKKYSQPWQGSLSSQSQVMRLALKHRSYIYSDPDLSDAFFTTAGTNTNVTAILVHKQDHQWLIIFDLTPGWIREEVSLFLNAVRTSLNYRLFTDIIGGHLQQGL